MEKRVQQSRCARRLNEILGKDYKVEYDVCESGLTYIYFKGEFVKRVPNDEMRSNLNVCDFHVTMQWLFEHGFDMMGNKINF